MSLLFSVNAFGVDFKVNGMYYNITSKENLTVSLTAPDYWGHYKGDIVIPEFVTYNNKKYRVTSLDDKSFRGCSKLISLTIPKSIISIETSFKECNNLKSVTLYCKNVTDYMFYERTSLKKVILGEGVETIGKKAFYHCGPLESLTISNTVISIGDNAFEGCGSLESVTIPSSVRSIGAAAFWGCVKMYKLVISEGVKTVGGYAFAHCKKLHTLEIPSSIKEWGRDPFYACGLYSVSIPKHYTRADINIFPASQIIRRDE